MTTATVEKDHALANAKAHLDSIIEWHTKSVLSVSDEETEEIEEEARESVLSVEYRQSCWQSVGSELTASQGRLLLTWGGPSCQIITDLDSYGEPSGNVEIQYQDWFKPWEGYWPSDDIDNASNDEARAALEWYVGLFFYGQ